MQVGASGLARVKDGIIVGVMGPPDTGSKGIFGIVLAGGTRRFEQQVSGAGSATG